MGWLERRNQPFPPAPTDEETLAIRAWNMMGGLDWNALPMVAEILGIEDMETLVAQMITIRDGINDA